MPRNRNKDYTVLDLRRNPVNIDDYRTTPWIQAYAGIRFDFRRWLYIGRPVLTEDGCSIPPTKNGSQKLLIHADRDKMVEALCEAVRNKPSVEELSKKSYCALGLTLWFEYLDYRFHAGEPVCDLADINKEVIQGFIRWLKHTKEAKTETGRLSFTSAKSHYTALKSVFQYLARQGLINGEIFPRNAFPNSNRATIGYKAYSKSVMTALISGIYRDIKAVSEGKLQLVESEILTLHLLAIAARTGRNTWPLLELSRDAVMPHPIKPDSMGLLVTYKRRGHNTSIQAFIKPPDVEDMISLPMDVLTLYKNVLKFTETLVSEVKKEHRNKLWIYRKAGSRKGKVGILSIHVLDYNIQQIVKRMNLTEEGRPFTLNISRLRKTFAQRIWQLTGGDLIATAELLGNTPPVTDRSYVAVSPEMVANFRCVGLLMHADWSGKLDDLAFLEVLAKETGIPATNLRDIAVGYNNTGVGRCTDPKNGANAPGNGALCTRWLECFRCPNQLVMETDLYRLFSFYFLLLKERNFISRNRWDELYGPIINIIDQEIVALNLKTKANPKGCFEPYRVNRAKAEAEKDPHPMWRDRSVLGSVS